MPEKISRGDLVILPFPFTNLTSSKVRPAIVLSGAEYHPEDREIIVTLVTSNMKAFQQQADYALRDWEQAGLHAPSMVKITLVTLQASMVRHRIGRLTPHDFKEVEKRVKLAMDLK